MRDADLTIDNHQPRAPTKKYLKRQDDILRAASGMLNQKGLKGMTLSEVANRFGLASTGIAYYFRSKEDLASACFRRAIAVHDALILEAAERPTFEGRLAQLVSRYFELLARIARGEADDIALFEDIRSLNDPSLEGDYVEMFRHLRGLFGEDARDQRDRAKINARTHYLVQQLVWARYWLVKYDPSDYPRAAERTLDILLHGLGADLRPWSPQRLLPDLSDRTADDGREIFLRAATQLINAQGYPGASVDRIAARLDVTKGSFYYRVDAKDDLIEICYARTIEAMRGAQRAADDLSADGRNRLASTLAHLIDNQLDGDVPLLRFLTASVPETIRQKVQVGCDRIDIHFGSTINDGIADGSLRVVDVQIASHMLTAAAIAGAELADWLPGPPDQDTTGDFLRPLFEGLVQ